MYPANISVWITTAGVIVSVAAIATTVALWRLDTRSRIDEARAARRQALVSRALELAERTNRGVPFASLTRIWFNPALEWAFLLPRFYYELRPNERPVARWVAAQCRLIQLAVKPKEVARLASMTAYSLAEWERGARTTTWFVQQVGDTDPIREPWTLPFRERARQTIWSVRAFFGWWAAAAGFFVLGRWIKDELVSIPRLFR